MYTLCLCVLVLILYVYTSLAASLWSHVTSIPFVLVVWYWCSVCYTSPCASLWSHVTSIPFVLVVWYWCSVCYTSPCASLWSHVTSIPFVLVFWYWYYMCTQAPVLLCDPISQVCTLCACVLPLVLYAYTSLAAFLWSHFTNMCTLCMCSGINITCKHKPWCFCDPMPHVCTLYSCVLVLWQCERARFCVEGFMAVYKFSFIH